ncbi:MAG TPA: septal ring lytic transglycosylase RlpA family protein [Thermoanaerobaculia bacterium]|nr:septal ring lytic transglycosylase RlpA family protein [Thermoanaerobaculia bacterium]
MRQRNDVRLAVLLSRLPFAILFLCIVFSAACSGNRRPASPATGSVGTPVQKGFASWYGPGFHGRRTANGERYDMNDLTAAHPSLPFGTRVAVRNPRTGQSVTVRINDRGPFSKSRVIDLSYAAAREVGVWGPGTAFVELYLAAGGERVGPSRFTVQVAAFSEHERAVALHQELARVYPETTVHSDGTWNRVQVGAFTDRDQAESVRRELAVLGLQSVVVAAH